MKQSRKQIEANLRKKIAKSENEIVSNFQKRLDRANKELLDLRKRVNEAESIKAELEEKVKLYEDWNYRLQEFCNMNEEDRKISIEEMRAEQNLKRYIEDFPLLKLFQNFI